VTERILHTSCEAPPEGMPKKDIIIASLCVSSNVSGVNTLDGLASDANRSEQYVYHTE
jgi:hypothetical protein